jgi:glutamate-5-semialdehyde dehydrogenase
MTGLRQPPSGIRVGQMRVPIGVFGMIFESRPNVTDRGRQPVDQERQRLHPARRLGGHRVQQGLAAAGAAGPGRSRAAAEAVQLVQTTDREAVGQLIAMPQFVDVIIPRGGKGLIERISREAKVPGDQAPGRQLPCLLSTIPATSTWP